MDFKCRILCDILSILPNKSIFLVISFYYLFVMKSISIYFLLLIYSSILIINSSSFCIPYYVFFSLLFVPNNFLVFILSWNFKMHTFFFMYQMLPRIYLLEIVLFTTLFYCTLGEIYNNKLVLFLKFWN